ncbi:MAG: DNA-binding protein [Elusimicrobiota bacterium]
MKRIIVLAAIALLCRTGARAAAILGKVAETMDSGGYTYARVTQDGSSTWVAVPVMKLKTGDVVAFQSGMVMQNFASPTLHRTFDSIVFSPGPVGADAGASGGAAHAGAARAGAHAGGAPHAAGPLHAGSKGSKKDATAKAEKAAGPDAYRVSEVYAKRAELAGKTISVRGKVVKVNEAMDRNWVHLQDGSGDDKSGDFDLLATTSEDAKVGEILTARGVVAKDKDFTMGYKYSVLIEKAALSR